jgi:hypothetical protein
MRGGAQPVPLFLVLAELPLRCHWARVHRLLEGRSLLKTPRILRTRQLVPTLGLCNPFASI